MPQGTVLAGRDLKKFKAEKARIYAELFRRLGKPLPEPKPAEAVQ